VDGKSYWTRVLNFITFSNLKRPLLLLILSSELKSFDGRVTQSITKPSIKISSPIVLMG
jgi:hypothetical protein